MAKLTSNNNKAVGPFTSVPPLPRLVFYYGGTKYYYPLIPPTSTLTWNGYIYSYDRSIGDTFGIGLFNAYTSSIYVNWNNEYIGETTLDETTFENITVWKTNSGTKATSGYYLSIDEKPNGTYIVQLLNLTFNAGVYSGNIIFDALYKLPSDFNFQDNVFYYVKNSNNFEGLKVNQGQCTFTTDPTTDNNFYIYQKGAGPKYVVPNKRVAAVNYDIPAGTYSPSTFKSLIDNYISQNGSRRVSNAFTATVNNQTINVKANTTIYNVNNSSSGSSTLTYGVNFSGSYMNAGTAFSSSTASRFTGNKVYITQSTGVISYFSNYMYYNITVSGIKFK